jgi:hypothetical protein
MIAIEMEQKTFEPGSEMSGNVRWSGLEDCDRLDIRLIWYTSGKGDQDFDIANKTAAVRPADSGEQAFSFPAPTHPHSFSGTLISLTWAIEVVQFPGQDAERCDIVIAPGGREIVLHQAPDIP